MTQRTRLALWPFISCTKLKQGKYNLWFKAAIFVQMMQGHVMMIRKVDTPIGNIKVIKGDGLVNYILDFLLNLKLRNRVFPQ